MDVLFWWREVLKPCKIKHYWLSPLAGLGSVTNSEIPTSSIYIKGRLTSTSGFGVPLPSLLWNQDELQIMIILITDWSAHLLYKLSKNNEKCSSHIFLEHKVTSLNCFFTPDSSFAAINHNEKQKFLTFTKLEPNNGYNFAQKKTKTVIQLSKWLSLNSILIY